MTVTRIGVMLTCNGPDGDSECVYSSDLQDACSAAEIRDLARRLGWETGGRAGGKDRCPKCRALARVALAAVSETSSTEEEK